MSWVTAAPQSPPCATNRVYPRRFISTTQARAMRAGSQPVVVGLAENPWPGSEGITRWKASAALRAVRGGIGERLDDLQLLDDRARPPVRDDQRQRVLVLGADVDEVDVQPVDLGHEVAAGRSASPRTRASRSLSPSSARGPASARARTPCESSVTVSRSGHLVALTRLRNSVSSASGKLDMERPDGVVFGGHLRLLTWAILGGLRSTLSRLYPHPRRRSGGRPRRDLHRSVAVDVDDGLGKSLRLLRHQARPPGWPEVGDVSVAYRAARHHP